MKHPNRVEQCREASGMTRAGVADRLRVSERTVYRWERGDNQIPDAKKREIADMFGVTRAELMGWDDEKAAAA